MLSCFFFFNDTATTEIYTLSLHDALPILPAPGIDERCSSGCDMGAPGRAAGMLLAELGWGCPRGEHRAERSEEHTSELQSRQYLVCRLLLEKKKKMLNIHSRHSMMIYPAF